jgi:hypothetical protein
MARSIEDIIGAIRSDPVTRALLEEGRLRSNGHPDGAANAPARYDGMGKNLYDEFRKGEKEMQKLIYRVGFEHSGIGQKIKAAVLYLVGGEVRMGLEEVFSRMTSDLKQQRNLLMRQKELCTRLDENLDDYYSRLLERQRSAAEDSISAESALNSYIQHIKGIDESMPHDRENHDERARLLLMKRRLNRGMSEAVTKLVSSSIYHHNATYSLSFLDSMSDQAMALQVYCTAVMTKAEVVAEHIDETVKVFEAMMRYLKQGLLTEARITKAQTAYTALTAITAKLMELPTRRLHEYDFMTREEESSRDIMQLSSKNSRYALEQMIGKSRLR